MSYRDLLHQLGSATETKVLAIFNAFTAGTLGQEQTVALIASTIAAANGHAVALADVSLAATLTLQLGEAVPALGLLPADDTARLRKAARTLLAVEDVTPERVARLGRAEPLDAAGTAYSDGIKRSRHVDGYRRGLSGNACELCVWLYKDGYTYPANQPMNRHKGCTCTQVPATRKARV